MTMEIPKVFGLHGMRENIKMKEYIIIEDSEYLKDINVLARCDEGYLEDTMELLCLEYPNIKLRIFKEYKIKC